MDNLPIQITTNKNRLRKKVQIDGFTYIVRLPGAGESLTFRQLGREMSRLEAKDKLTEAETESYEEMRSRSTSISLDLFDAQGDPKAKTYIDSLEITTLLEVIAQIFGEAKIDESAQETPNIS